MTCPRKLHEPSPNLLSDHLRLLAEDLVQSTPGAVLRRPRLLHSDDARYLLRALRETQATQYRAAMCRPTIGAAAGGSFVAGSNGRSRAVCRRRAGRSAW
jgi:hypothetical protein